MRPIGDLFKKIRLDFITLFLLAFLLSLSLSLSWINLPFEQDQGSKAAKVLLMSSGRLSDLLPVVNKAYIYEDHFISFYYLIIAIVQLVTQCSTDIIFRLMNVFSSILFVFFLYFMSKSYEYVAKQHNGPLLALIIAIACPPILVTFSYGNEVALATTLYMAAIFALVSCVKKRAWMSGVLTAFAVASRADFVFSIPGLMILCVLSSDQNERIKNLVVFAISGLCVGLLYFAIAIRSIPTMRPAPSFTSHWVLRLLAIYATFGPSLWFLLCGSSVLGWRPSRSAHLAITLFLFLTGLSLYYGANLGSSKHVVVLGPFLSVLAMDVLSVLPRRQDMANRTRYSRLCLIASVTVFAGSMIATPVPASPWVYAGSNPTQALPTYDNLVPLGNYIGYYRGMASGEVQRKYICEIRAAEIAIHDSEQLRASDAILVGIFNGHFLNYAAAQAGYTPANKKWVKGDHSVTMISFEEFLERQNHSQDQSGGNTLSTVYYISTPALLRGRLQNVRPDKLVAQIADLPATPIYSSAYKTIPTVFRVGPAVVQEASSYPTRFGDLEETRRILFLEGHFAGFPSCEMGVDFDYADNRPLYAYAVDSQGHIGDSDNQVIYQDSQWAMYKKPADIPGKTPVTFALTYPEATARLLW